MRDIAEGVLKMPTRERKLRALIQHRGQLRDPIHLDLFLLREEAEAVYKEKKKEKKKQLQQRLKKLRRKQKDDKKELRAHGMEEMSKLKQAKRQQEMQDAKVLFISLLQSIA